MAIIKVKDKHGHTRAGIDYILNPEKTMELSYTSTMNCSIADADKQFDKTQRFYQHNITSSKSKLGAHSNNVTSLHIIQSFKGQEVSPARAHQLARELIQAKFGPYAQAVIATHSDTDNVHNHVVINTVDIQGKKIHHDKVLRADLRRHSDSLCRKYGLSVIEPSKEPQKGLHYKEYMERGRGTSWKEDIRNDIDGTIMACDNWDEFLRQMREMGYKINNSPTRQHVTLQKDGFRPIRLTTLGYHYSEGRIKQRLRDPDKHKITGLGQLSYGRDKIDKIDKINNINKADKINDSTSKDRPLSLLSIIRLKRTEHALVNNLFALQYLLAIERIFRLIIRNGNKRKSKLDLSQPYSLSNDFHLARALYRFKVIDKHRVRSKEELRRVMESERYYEPQPGLRRGVSNGQNRNQAREVLSGRIGYGKSGKISGISKV